MKSFNNKGFTLPQILIAVLVIAVLAAVTFMVYDRFIERARATDAENTIGVAADAQGRQLMRKGRYTLLWTALDATQLATYMNKKGDYVSRDGKIFLTKGGGVEKPRGGFKMYFEEINGLYFIVAERMGWHYHYLLIRPLTEERTYCVHANNDDTDTKFCVDFMNVDSADQLPPDPRKDVRAAEARNAFL